MTNLRKDFFNTGETKKYSFRINVLKNLKKAIIEDEKIICRALYDDLGKSYNESYITEISMVLSELNYQIKNLKKLMKPIKKRTPISLFPAKSYVYPEPYGDVLIISPWNYPFLLTFNPLIGAIAAGNTALVKPSEIATNTLKVLERIIKKAFMSKHVDVYLGGVKETKELLIEKFDYIFFTGSTNVGKVVMEAASKNLTPVTLELGGKSPAIVFSDSNISLAAKKIAYGKTINAGQTCIAPDYLIIHEDNVNIFVDEYKKTLMEFYGKDILNNDSYPKIISIKHFERLINLFKDEKILLGGKYSNIKIEPTIIKVNRQSKIMSEEIFGPILPVITYKEVEEVFEHLVSSEKPLASYVFTNNKNIKEKIKNSTSSGALVFNDTLMHFVNKNLPFGGVGNSGMGKYHGIESFKTFSHYKSILDKKMWLDVKVRYHPLTDKKTRVIKKIISK